MSPFMKGVLGFVGCAGVCGAAYAIGKHVGREETLKEVELEEKYIAIQSQPQPQPEPVKSIQQPIVTEQESEVVETPKQTAVNQVRKMHGFKNKLFGGASVIKDLLGNPDDKQLTMTVENGDIIARISQKQGG